MDRRLLAALVALAVAYGWLIQGGGGVSNSHYALVKALASGDASIDRVFGELGDFGTNDYTVVEGKKYSNKAPGFALLNVPAYVLLDAAGVRKTGDPARMLWALGLLTVVLPALGLVWLVVERASALDAPLGLAAGVALGTATLLLPYATLFLSHALSALLVFASFWLLWRSRVRARATFAVAAAGALGGYAVATEYPNALAVVALGVYALADRPRVRRGLAYALGALVGVVPLLLYNAWAFGSPFHNSYSGSFGGGESADALFGAPRPTVALELLLSSNGLLVLNPLLVCAAAGWFVLWRRGVRVEAALVAVLVVAFLTYNSAYFTPFGGTWIGTRHLLPLLPFLAIGLAPAARAFPLTTLALAVVSAVLMAAVASTYALAAYDGRWFDRVADRLLTPAVPSLVGISGWYATLPFFVALCIAAGAALANAGRQPRRRGDAALAAVALTGWAAVAVVANPPAAGSEVSPATALAVAAVAAAAAFVAAAVATPPLLRPAAER